MQKGQHSCPICRKEFATLLKFKKLVNRKRTKTRQNAKKPVKEPLPYREISVSGLLPKPSVVCEYRPEPNIFTVNHSSLMSRMMEMFAFSPQIQSYWHM